MDGRVAEIGTERGGQGWPLAALVALCALLNVAPVLGWVTGLAQFSTWFVRCSLPALVVLVAVALVSTRRHGPAFDRVRRGITLGTIGGIIGTLGYDLVRIPFVVLGLRVLAPIESYGVLLTGAETSTSLTAFAGWGYHFANGVCFGVAYAVIAPRAKVRWAVVWALTLETATILTPFASAYNLSGHYDLISIAYGAHVPYGLGLGLVVARGDTVLPRLLTFVKWPGLAALGTVVVGLLVWLRPAAPYTQPPAVVLQGERFDHAWTRLAPGGCMQIANRDATAVTIGAADGSPSVAPGTTGSVCFSTPGIYRVKPSETPYAGGFVLVDGELPDQPHEATS